MAEEWRIDTLDARGGLAFAARRGPLEQLETPGTGDADRRLPAVDEPCIHIGPPDFSPTVVPNRAIALAAGRGCFQTGLFIEDVEVTFESPLAIAEFVRRAYLSGGAGDGTEGGGGNGPPPPPDDRPPDDPTPMPERPMHDGLLVAGIEAAAAAFDTASLGSKLGKSTPFGDWPQDLVRESDQSSKVDDGLVGNLAYAAQRVLMEIVDRFPKNSDHNALLVWQASASTIRSMVDSIGLPSMVWQGRGGKLLAQRMHYLLERYPSLPACEACLKMQARDAGPAPLLTWLLFFSSAPLGDRDACHRALIGWLSFEDWQWPWRVTVPRSSPGDRNPIAQLRRLPLPSDMRMMVPEDVRPSASLYHALAVFLARPQVAKQQPGLVEIMLLAAVCVVGASSPVSCIEQCLYSRWPQSPHRQLVFALLDAAWRWLREQLPREVFPPAIEDLIKGTAYLRYLADEVATSTTSRK